ncbi:hypothetical protein AB0H02_32490, partial [Streptomyces californicus]|uniref:hypothetical protein n=1 Tax=Streptomyces californicus TaxID=67351 RepID=UPI0033C7E58E
MTPIDEISKAEGLVLGGDPRVSSGLRGPLAAMLRQAADALSGVDVDASEPVLVLAREINRGA